MRRLTHFRDFRFTDSMARISSDNYRAYSIISPPLATTLDPLRWRLYT